MRNRLIISAIVFLGLGVMSVRASAGGGYTVTLKPKGLLCTESGTATGQGGSGNAAKTLGCSGDGVCLGGVTDPTTGVCSNAPRALASFIYSCSNGGNNFAVGAHPEFMENVILVGTEGLGKTAKNGKFMQAVLAPPNPNTLVAITEAGLCQQGQPGGGGNNWAAFDYAFCAGADPSVFEAQGEMTTDTQILQQVRAACTLACSDIQFVRNGTFTSGKNYDCKVCPKDVAGDWDCAQCVHQNVDGSLSLNGTCPPLPQ